MLSKSRARPAIVIDEAKLRAHPLPSKVVLLPIQVAALAGVSSAKLARMHRNGSGPHAEKLGRYNLYYLPSVLKWLNERRASDGEASRED